MADPRFDEREFDVGFRTGQGRSHIADQDKNRMDHDHRTEAACLLEQGTSYRRRIGLEPTVGAGEPIFAGLKHGAFSIYIGDAPIYHFDLEGRWQRGFVEGIHYLRGLDGVVQAMDRVREGSNLVLNRRRLGDAEASDFDARVRSLALELIAGIYSGRLRRQDPPAVKAQSLANGDLLNFLERISRWDSAAWIAHRERYLATYGPLPVLPPECQNAVVVQATLGHAQGRSFGLSPVNEPLARSPAEFEQHATAVAVLWGRRLLQSRAIFLAGSDVLKRPVEDLAAYLDTIGRTFPIQPVPQRGAGDPSQADETAPRFDGVHVFLDDFAGPRLDRAAWGELAARGLIRVSLGIESGDAAARVPYQKRWVNDEFQATVADLKKAGLGASILTLVGAGGVERANPHVNETSRLIESLALGPGDFVFLLDENEVRDPLRNPTGLTFLQGPAWSEQQVKLKEALSPLKKRGVKVLPYTLEKQWA
jgi:hypothetical protein